MESDIDFVFTYVDFDDINYVNTISKFANQENPAILKSKNYFLNRYKDFKEIYFAIQFVKKFMKFIRNIYIVTPTPKQISAFYQKSNIIIINDIDLLPDKHIVKPNFKSTVIESYLHKIPGLANLFFYACDDMFIGNYVDKEFFFDKGVPIVFLERKKYMTENPNAYTSAAFYDVFNANMIYKEKFNKFPKIWHNHQITLVRKDCCQITWRIFKKQLRKNGLTRFRKPIENGIHFILLQHLVGLYFDLYKHANATKKHFAKTTGFYDYNQNAPWERFSLISNNNSLFFCINALQKEYYHYFIKLLDTFFNPNKIEPIFIIDDLNLIKNSYIDNISKKFELFENIDNIEEKETKIIVYFSDVKFSEYKKKKIQDNFAWGILAQINVAQYWFNDILYFIGKQNFGKNMSKGKKYFEIVYSDKYLAQLFSHIFSDHERDSIFSFYQQLLN